ncbi:hypothetical protein, partial [uncultured Demequina sp.]|uniref:hypothetical protein n=1 Tax=uncultured Demequina sp. TaxID=693499 RepID=UPI0025FDD890
GLIALLVVPAFRMFRFSFTPGVPDKRSHLTFAIATATVGFIVSMFFFDAFAFMQTLLVLSLLYAIAAWAMTEPVEEDPVEEDPVGGSGAEGDRAAAASEPRVPAP